MKRLLVILLIGLISLAACGGEKQAENTAQPSQEISQTSVVTPSPAQTATPRVNPTLPPAATLAVGGSALPTRTSPPSITPAPTRTTNLNIPITPDTATPVSQPSGGGEADNKNPAFTVTYTNLTDELRSYPPAFTLDAVVENSQEFVFDNNIPQLNLELILSGETEAVSVTAILVFTLDPEVGRILVHIDNMTFDATPGQAYSGELMDTLDIQLQTALDAVIIRKVGESAGEGSVFAVTELQVDASGLAIKTVVE